MRNLTVDGGNTATATARTWAEVDSGTLAGNARAAARLAGAGNGIVAVVKADAYGHGAVPVARALAAAGVERFAVAGLAEALELRQFGIGGEIHTLSPLLPSEMPAAVRADLTPFVSSAEQIESLAGAAWGAPLPARCFLVIDTGMGREGCRPDEAVALWRRAKASGAVRVTGIATHFSSADEPDGDEPTAGQAAVFAEAVREIGPDELQGTDDGRGNTGVWLSLCNSPATLRPPDLPDAAALGGRGYLFRAGLLLYGIEPYRGAYENLSDIRPALSWRARVTLLRDLPAGATVGYGRTHTLTRPSRIATVAAGYADGLPRRLSGTGHVLRRSQRLPIVGRVSMDQCQIDVTDAADPVRLGDIVTIVGRDGSAVQTAFDLAEQIGTTPHEPTCLLTRRVPRLYNR